jgi:hypothetical protein
MERSNSKIPGSSSAIKIFIGNKSTPPLIISILFHPQKTFKQSSLPVCCLVDRCRRNPATVNRVMKSKDRRKMILSGDNKSLMNTPTTYHR